MIEVFPGQYERAEPGDTLVTRDVYTCLVVALRIRGVGTGYMCHYPTTEVTVEEVLANAETMMAATEAEAEDPELVSAWTTGCAPLYDDAETAALRQSVVEKIQGRNFRLVRELWVPNEDYAVARATLDCQRARFTAPFVHIGDM